MPESLAGKSLLESFPMEEPGQWALESITTPSSHQRLFATYHFLAYEGKYSSSHLTCKYHQQASKELQRKERISHECVLFMGAPSQPLVLPRPQQPTLNQSSEGACTGLPRQIPCHIQTKGKWQRCGSEGASGKSESNSREYTTRDKQGHLCNSMVAAECRDTGIANKRT